MKSRLFRFGFILAVLFSLPTGLFHAQEPGQSRDPLSEERLLSGWKIKPAGERGAYLQQFPDPYTLVLPGAELSINIPIGIQGTIRKPYVYERDFSCPAPTTMPPASR